MVARPNNFFFNIKVQCHNKIQALSLLSFLKDDWQSPKQKIINLYFQVSFVHKQFPGRPSGTHQRETEAPLGYKSTYRYYIQSSRGLSCIKWEWDIADSNRGICFKNLLHEPPYAIALYDFCCTCYLLTLFTVDMRESHWRGSLTFFIWKLEYTNTCSLNLHTSFQ